MGKASRVPRREPTENDGQTSTGTDRNVRKVIPIAAARISFGDLARFAWPSKAEANLSHLTGYDGRTCRRWLAGDTEPPAEALGVILAEIMKRFHQR
jgi:hypothetical protein